MQFTIKHRPSHIQSYNTVTQMHSPEMFALSKQKNMLIHSCQSLVVRRRIHLNYESL